MTEPQLTARAIVTGLLIGALLTPCNIYSGLKIGWAFNMSIAAALLSYAFWKLSERTAGSRPWGLLENNINQTTASASASIISAGLVAPIPALTMLTGQQLTYSLLATWVLVVSLLGVVVAVGIRRQMLVRDRLVFPAGVATAEVVREIYARGTEAGKRVRMLLTGAAIAGAIKLVDEFVATIPKLKLPFALPGNEELRAKGIASVSSGNLGFLLDSSLLMIGFGAIIGLHAGLSLLLGAILAWGVLGPWALLQGWAQPGVADPGTPWFGALVEWLLWPGVALMVTASLTSVAFSLLAARRRQRDGTAAGAVPVSKAESEAEAESAQVPVGGFIAGLVLVGLLAVAAQTWLFAIHPLVGILAVLLAFVLALVAARVTGETGITPIGAMGKVSQFSFAVISPSNVTANLMSANVTGGAAGQCADMMQDFRTGQLLGASPRLQAIAQVFGVLMGSLVGTAAYVVLIPDPVEMLITPEWPAPAVATWKAVAEVLQGGLANLPPAAAPAIVLGALAGLLLATAAHRLPEHRAHWLPSPTALGLAFVIPAWNSLSLFLGAVLGYLLWKYVRSWAERFVIVLAAGFVAGESLAGISGALARLLAPGS
jgi:putative OPT family oligopeptide transporter